MPINIEVIKKQHYESGELECEMPYVNGREEGIEKWYYKSGELESETLFVNNRAEGI